MGLSACSVPHLSLPLLPAPTLQPLLPSGHHPSAPSPALLLPSPRGRHSCSESVCCWEISRTFLRTRDTRGGDIKLVWHGLHTCVTTGALPVGKAPATRGFPRLQRPHLSPGSQPCAQQDLGAVPTSQKGSGQWNPPHFSSLDPGAGFPPPHSQPFPTL